jgi:hypothetical protein
VQNDGVDCDNSGGAAADVVPVETLLVTISMCVSVEAWMQATRVHGPIPL